MVRLAVIGIPPPFVGLAQTKERMIPRPRARFNSRFKLGEANSAASDSHPMTNGDLFFMRAAEPEERWPFETTGALAAANIPASSVSFRESFGPTLALRQYVPATAEIAHSDSTFQKSSRSGWPHETSYSLFPAVPSARKPTLIVPWRDGNHSPDRN